jgi:sugar phosphate isomerase/epimerase
MPLQVGLRDYVIKSTDDHDFFLKASALGFEGVEPGPTREQLRNPQQARLDVLREASKATGLIVASLSLNHHNQGGLGSADTQTREAAMQDIRTSLKWAGILGSDTLLIPFFGLGSLQNPECCAKAVECFRILCAEAHSAGITLAYEGDLCASAILEMAEKVDSPAFACYFDLANPMVYGRDPVEELRILRHLVASVHIKDFQQKLGDCRPGQGRVPLKECARVLHEIGYDGWLILETPPASAGLVSGDLSFVRRAFLAA